MRNVPDVVLDANESAYFNGSWSSEGGTSLSAPVWASFVSLVNQGLGEYGPVGFVNPLLYQLAQSGSYASDFHDITRGNSGYYPAEPGFDDATGLGSLNGLNLYNDLVGVTLALTKGASVRTLPTFGAVGTSVQILGKGLTGASSVTFNGKAATFTVDSSTDDINLGASRSEDRFRHSSIPRREGTVVPLPISLGPSTEQVYLEMYGTGIRNASSVTASVGGVGVPVLFSGAAPGFAGLDQVNIGPLPRSLAGAGSAGIVVTADTQAANTVNVTIQ
jgi:subtilase family serine protease